MRLKPLSCLALLHLHAIAAHCNMIYRIDLTRFSSLSSSPFPYHQNYYIIITLQTKHDGNKSYTIIIDRLCRYLKLSIILLNQHQKLDLEHFYVYIPRVYNNNNVDIIMYRYAIVYRSISPNVTILQYVTECFRPPPHSRVPLDLKI